MDEQEAALRIRVAELEAANEALLDGHAKLSVAYLAQRVNLLDDENRRLSLKVVNLETGIEVRLKELRAELKQLTRKQEAEHRQTEERLTKAAHSFKELRNGNGQHNG